MNFLFLLVLSFGLTENLAQQAAFKERKMEWSELPQKAGTAALLRFMQRMEWPCDSQTKEITEPGFTEQKIEDNEKLNY